MKNNIYQSFVDNLKYQEEQDMVKALDSFIKYLCFEDFSKSAFSYVGELLSTEVLGFDERRIFLLVIGNKDSSVTGRYVITDKKSKVLDVITFKLENNEWSEVE